ncbi:MAG: hypothetical protein IKY44_03770 [Clostridia bacterium]|nr:hypothetical protein [Clostridia bacterium]
MKYQKPEVNMYKFDVEDVITTSMPIITTTSPAYTTTSPSNQPSHDVDWEEL